EAVVRGSCRKGLPRAASCGIAANLLLGGAALDLADEVVEDTQVLGIEGVAAHAAEMVAERAHRGRWIIERIPDHAQCRPGIEAGRWIEPLETRVGPQPETCGRERRPREQWARIVLPRWRHVLMADDLRAGDVPARGEVREQTNQAVDLRGRKRHVAVVVDLDADGRRVDVGHRAPAPGPSVPRAIDVADQLVDEAIVAVQ